MAQVGGSLMAAATQTPACAVCGERLTELELEAVRADVDFVEHGDRGHLIRIEPAKIVVKIGDLFDFEPCGRCGGSGRYSWNQMDGDRCYGCSGTGQRIAQAHADLYADYRETRDGLREKCAERLEAGDRALLGERYVENGRNMIRYETVRAVRVTDERCAWRTVDGEEIATSWYVIVELENGTEQRMSGNVIVRCAKPTYKRFLAAVKPETAKHLRERYLAAGVPAEALA